MVCVSAGVAPSRRRAARTSGAGFCRCRRSADQSRRKPNIAPAVLAIRCVLRAAAADHWGPGGPPQPHAPNPAKRADVRPRRSAGFGKRSRQRGAVQRSAACARAAETQQLQAVRPARPNRAACRGQLLLSSTPPQAPFVPFSRSMRRQTIRRCYYSVPGRRFCLAHRAMPLFAAPWPPSQNRETLNRPGGIGEVALVRSH